MIPASTRAPKTGTPARRTSLMRMESRFIFGTPVCDPDGQFFKKTEGVARNGEALPARRARAGVGLARLAAGLRAQGERPLRARRASPAFRSRGGHRVVNWPPAWTGPLRSRQ